MQLRLSSSSKKNKGEELPAAPAAPSDVYRPFRAKPDSPASFTQLGIKGYGPKALEQWVAKYSGTHETTKTFKENLQALSSLESKMQGTSENELYHNKFLELLVEWGANASAFQKDTKTEYLHRMLAAFIGFANNRKSLQSELKTCFNYLCSIQRDFMSKDSALHKLSLWLIGKLFLKYMQIKELCC